MTLSQKAEIILDLEELCTLDSGDIQKRLADLITTALPDIVRFPEKYHDYHQHSAELVFTHLLMLSGRYQFKIVSDETMYYFAKSLLQEYLVGSAETGYHYNTLERRMREQERRQSIME